MSALFLRFFPAMVTNSLLFPTKEVEAVAIEKEEEKWDADCKC